MSKKLFALLSAIVGALGAIASAIVTYCVVPATASLVVAAIGIGVTGIIEILQLFVKTENAEKKEK